MVRGKREVGGVGAKIPFLKWLWGRGGGGWEPGGVNAGLTLLVDILLESESCEAVRKEPCEADFHVLVFEIYR